MATVPSRPQAPWPSVTVCICTHNRPLYVLDCLSGLARQTVGPDGFQTLIVDSGSDREVQAKLAVMAGEYPNTRTIRVDRPGLSIARNAGADAAQSDYIAYIDDDAIATPSWIEQIRNAIASVGGVPALLGGRILPLWEAPLPAWWPPPLRGILSIIETEGRGTYRGKAISNDLAPYGANMIVHIATMRSLGGFGDSAGRDGGSLLSDEDVQLAWQLQDAGYAIHYDSSIVVHHQIQASRLTPEWLLRRMYWQGVSSVVTRRVTSARYGVWRSLPRRLLVAMLFLPVVLIPSDSVRLLGCRWRLAYSLGFVRGIFGAS
jgi:glycosyltransferase involved in cell wall biosynthesis